MHENHGPESLSGIGFGGSTSTAATTTSKSPGSLIQFLVSTATTDKPLILNKPKQCLCFLCMPITITDKPLILDKRKQYLCHLCMPITITEVV